MLHPTDYFFRNVIFAYMVGASFDTSVPQDQVPFEQDRAVGIDENLIGLVKQRGWKRFLRCHV